MKAFILLLIALILATILIPISFIFGCISALGKGELTSYFFKCALAIDRSGGAIGSYLLNLIMIKPHGYQFGNGKETMSSVIGKNKKNITLIWFGKMINLLLDKIEKDHTLISIDEQI